MLKVDNVKAEHTKCGEEISTSPWGQPVSLAFLVFRLVCRFPSVWVSADIQILGSCALGSPGYPTAELGLYIHINSSVDRSMVGKRRCTR